MLTGKLSRLQRDGLVALSMMVALFLLFHFIEAFELIYQLTREHEDWQADEFVLLFLALPLPLAWFALRRIRDITRAADQRILLENSLAHSRKLESLGTLAGGVAHEINNQLTPVLSMSEMLLSDMQESDPARRKLELIHRGASRARQTVLRIREFSRSGEGPRDHCDIATTINYARELVRHFTPSSIEIEFELQDLHGQSSIGCIDLEAVIINLFSNAIDAIGPGRAGRILFEAETRQLLAGPNKLLTPGRYVCIRVSDSGSGIPDDIRKKVFDPFFTTKAVGKGMGLGLSIIHSILQRAGGDIQLSSRPGFGASFMVYLPVAEPTDSAEPQTSASDGS